MTDSENLDKGFGGHIRAVHGPKLDCDPYGCNVCNLFICTVCGGAEGSLASECPKTQMTEEQEKNVYAGKIDFKDGRWINL